MRCGIGAKFGLTPDKRRISLHAAKTLRMTRCPSRVMTDDGCLACHAQPMTILRVVAGYHCGRRRKLKKVAVRCADPPAGCTRRELHGKETPVISLHRHRNLSCKNASSESG